MQGKLKSFVALNDANGVQQTYVHEGKTNYKFTVTLECAGETVVGTAMSSKTQPSWKIGDDYSFDKTVSGANGQYVNIKKMTSLTNPPSFGGGKAPNPAFCIQKCYEGAVECACLFFELNPDIAKADNFDPMVTKLYGFILTSKVEADRWMYLSAIRLALQYLKAFPSPILTENQTLSMWLIVKATQIYSSMKDTVNKQIEFDKQA